MCCPTKEKREKHRSFSFWTILSFYINETDIVQSTTSSLGFITRAPSMIIKKGSLFPSIPFVRFRHAFLLLRSSSLNEIRGSHSLRTSSYFDSSFSRRRSSPPPSPLAQEERVRLLRLNRDTSHLPLPTLTAPTNNNSA